MKKKIVIAIILLILAVPVAVLIGLFPLLQSPRVVNKLAAYAQPVTGIYLHVEDIHLNRHLGGYISGMQIKEMKEKGFNIFVPRADIKGSVTGWLKINIETLVLTDPGWVFYLKEKSETNPLEILKKMPRAHLLEVKNGRLDLKNDAAVYSMSGMNMTVRDFNPAGSGRLSGTTDFVMTSEHTVATGSVDTALDITGFSPVPLASGSLRIVLNKSSWGQNRLENGVFTSDIKLKSDTISFANARAEVRNIVQGEGKGQLAVKDIKAQFNASYDQKTSDFSITSLALSGTDIGLLKGEISVTANPMVWNTSLQASSLDIAQLFGLIKPLLPADYHDWTLKGKSTFEVASWGRQDRDALTWKAKAVVDLREGGFASPDGSKAAEKISGRLKLNIDAPEQNRKGTFDVSMESAIGEFLWGTYYQDFKGKKVNVSAQGAFSPKPFSLSLSGTSDFFQTGNYQFTVDLSQDRNLVSLHAKKVSLKKLFSVAAQNYISQNYPAWKDLTVEGGADIKMTARMSGQQKSIEGDITLRDGAVRSSSNRLVLTGLNVSLPYDLALTGGPAASTSGNRTGTVAFDLLEKDHIRVSKLVTPVVFSGNRLILPDPMNIKVFGGEISLAGFRAENLLRADLHAVTNLGIKHIDIQQMVGQEAPVPLAGIINGNLPVITFRNGRWTARGSVIAQIFGGQIKIENIAAARLLSSSRFLGADASFDHIDLEKLTSSLEVGRMTGLIKGSLKNYSMEYGQPSGFDLMIETDSSRNVPKLISVDAINNLSIISTGSAAISAILSSGVNQFFKDYPYSRIGMRCTLKDDIFKLRGLIHDSGKEYLVRKGLFRGVDIINQNPDNHISFKDMAERMSRIKESKKETNNVP
jgi:hypothetical protein